MAAVNGQNSTTEPNRSWVRYSLRSLLLAVLAISIGFAWLGHRISVARQQRAVVAAIHEAGGAVIYDWEYCDSASDVIERLGREPPVPKWVTECLGNDLFYEVAEVSFPGGWQYTCPKCTDDTLAHLHRLNNLKLVSLQLTQVTDEGVDKLQKASPRCEIDRR